MNDVVHAELRRQLDRYVAACDVAGGQPDRPTMIDAINRMRACLQLMASHVYPDRGTAAPPRSPLREHRVAAGELPAFS